MAFPELLLAFTENLDSEVLNFFQILKVSDNSELFVLASSHYLNFKRRGNHSSTVRISTEPP